MVKSAEVKYNVGEVVKSKEEPLIQEGITPFRLQAVQPLSFNYCLTSVCELLIQWPTIPFLECSTEILK